MTQVRLAKESDLPDALSLVHEFQKEGLDEFGLFCDDEKAKIIMCSNIEHSLVLENDGKVIGCLGGFITQGIVSTDLVYQELIWYVSKKYRLWGLKLLRELENKCRQWGIKKILMIHMGNLNAEKMKHFYENLGYKFLEAHYIKDIS